MNFSNGNTNRRNCGRYQPTSSRPTSPQLTDWLADKLRRFQTKELALLAECSERAAENAKLGRSAFNMASLTALCRNDPIFGAAYVEYIGLLRPGEGEFAAAFTKAANAYARMKAAENAE